MTKVHIAKNPNASRLEGKTLCGRELRTSAFVRDRPNSPHLIAQTCKTCLRAALDTAEDRGPDGAGFYVMGEHTSRSWHPTRGEAEAEARAIKLRGAWGGTPPRVETAARRDG